MLTYQLSTKLKCQEIVNFHYDQELTLESKLMIDQGLYKNLQVTDNFSTKVFILSCREGVSLYLLRVDKQGLNISNLLRLARKLIKASNGLKKALLE